VVVSLQHGRKPTNQEEDNVKTRKVAAKVLIAALTIGGATTGLAGVSGAAQPAVGSVGQATVRAPEGLVEKLADTNGYRCNTGNNGAGRGNPALARCEQSAPTVSTGSGEGGDQPAPTVETGTGGGDVRPVVVVENPFVDDSDGVADYFDS
jgi:hypothetical protein